MSIIRCSICDLPFDVSDQVEAHYFPPECESCLNEAQEQLQQTWKQLDKDESAIEEFCNAS